MCPASAELHIGRLSVDYSSTIGRLSVDYRPIVGWQSTDISVEATFCTRDPNYDDGCLLNAITCLPRSSTSLLQANCFVVLNRGWPVSISWRRKNYLYCSVARSVINALPLNAWQLAKGSQIDEIPGSHSDLWPVLCICRFDTMIKLANRNGQPPALSASLDNSKTRYHEYLQAPVGMHETSRKNSTEVLTAGRFVYLRLFLFARLIATAPKI